MMICIRKHIVEGQEGLELINLDENATVQDLFVPLQLATDDALLPKREHPKRMATCAGCSNNCCRRFDILPDLLTTRKLAQYLGQTWHDFILHYVFWDEDSPFAQFRGRHCPFLSTNLCAVYAARPAFCRFYLCVPQGERLEKLKAQILLLGEVALRHELIANGLASQAQAAHYARSHQEVLDWPQHNPLANAQSYADVLLRDCCSLRLWQWLQLPVEQTEWQSYSEWCKQHHTSTDQ